MNSGQEFRVYRGMCEERLRFGEFELRPGSGELFQDGTPVRLQPQPAKVLELLVRHPGEVVSREELRRHLWGDETFVDFEHGLNFSIRQLRRALGDSADTPRFVETVPRHGYRFLQPVTVEEIRAPAPEAPAPAAPRRPRTRRRVVLGIAAALVLFLVLSLFGAQRLAEPALSLGDVSKEAREAYLEGRHFTRRGATPEEREKGVAAFQRAALLEPRFADAYARLSQAEMSLPKRWQDRFPVAEAAAHRAVALDPRQAEAHEILGFISFLRLDIRQTQEETERALSADPDLATAQALRAKYLAVLGRHDEAIAAAERTRALDPEGRAMDPDLLCYQFLLARRYSETIDCGLHIAETAPADSSDVPWARLWALWAARLQGDSGAALAIAEAMARQGAVPSPQRFETLRDFWQWDLRRLDALGQHVYGERAVDLLALGERQRALDLLEAVDYTDWSVPFLVVDPRFDALRGDPRFEKLIQRLGLPRVSPPSSRGA